MFKVQFALNKYVQLEFAFKPQLRAALSVKLVCLILLTCKLKRLSNFLRGHDNERMHRGERLRTQGYSSNFGFRVSFGCEICRQKIRFWIRRKENGNNEVRSITGFVNDLEAKRE